MSWYTDNGFHDPIPAHHAFDSQQLEAMGYVRLEGGGWALPLTVKSPKPVVHYTEAYGDLVVGQRAILGKVFGHTSPRVVNDGDPRYPVFTTAIVRIGDAGEFETRNTIYRVQA